MLTSWPIETGKVATKYVCWLLLLFIQQKHKHNEMAFLTSRYANKHIHLALGVEHTAWDNGGVPSMLTCYVGLVSLSFMRLKSCKCCTAATKVWYSLLMST